jgi:hypothetical protein
MPAVRNSPTREDPPAPHLLAPARDLRDPLAIPRSVAVLGLGAGGEQLDPSRARYVHFLSLDLTRARAGLCSGVDAQTGCIAVPPGSELDQGEKRPTIGSLVPPIGRTNSVRAEYRRACFVYDRQGDR